LPSLTLGLLTLSLLQNHLGHCVFGSVRNREVRGGCSAGFIKLARAPMKQDQRSARVFGGDFHILPADAAAPSRLQGLQRGFFCRETSGIMLGGYRAPRFAVSAFGVGEDAFSESRRARDRFADAPDFNNVDSN